MLPRYTIFNYIILTPFVFYIVVKPSNFKLYFIDINQINSNINFPLSASFNLPKTFGF